MGGGDEVRDDIDVHEDPYAVSRRRAWARVAHGAASALQVRGLSETTRAHLREVLDGSLVAAGVTPGRRRPWRAVRRIVLGAFVVAMAVGAFTVANDRWLDPYHPATRELPSVVDPQLSQSRVPDPVDDIDWGLRVYNEPGTGRRCVVLGQLLAGNLGRASAGRFRPFGPRPKAYCKERDQRWMIIVRRFAVPPDGRRTAVFGVVDRTVLSLGIGRDAPGIPMPIGPDDGTVLYVVKGIETLAGFKKYISDSRGTTVEDLSGG